MMLRKVHILRKREVPLVKVQWDSYNKVEVTWEKEEDVIVKYPDLPE